MILRKLSAIEFFSQFRNGWSQFAVFSFKAYTSQPSAAVVGGSLNNVAKRTKDRDLYFKSLDFGSRAAMKRKKKNQKTSKLRSRVSKQNKSCALMGSCIVIALTFDVLCFRDFFSCVEVWTLRFEGLLLKQDVDSIVEMRLLQLVWNLSMNHGNIRWINFESCLTIFSVCLNLSMRLLSSVNKFQLIFSFRNLISTLRCVCWNLNWDEVSILNRHAIKSYWSNKFVFDSAPNGQFL